MVLDWTQFLNQKIQQRLSLSENCQNNFSRGFSFYKIMDTKGLNKLGSIKTQDGEVVMEMFSAPNALTEGADAISQGLYILSEILQRSETAERCSSALGGTYGYGATFENDVFMMRPYCWCESDDCLWCGGQCGCDSGNVEYFLDGEPVERWQDASDTILGDSYERLRALFNKNIYKGEEFEDAQAEFDAKCAERTRRLTTIYPAITHTCEPKGMFNDRPRGEDYGFQQAPHFWHKASGLKIAWYKWIGRDMEVSNPNLTFGDWRKIYTECLESIPQEARDKAEAEHAFENTPEYKQQEKEAMERMWKVMEKMDFGERGYRIPFDEKD